MRCSSPYCKKNQISPQMSIERLWPGTDWNMAWKNLWTAPVSDATKATWYKIIHDIVPTKERLHKFHIAPTEYCGYCERTDTLRHRLIECGEGRNQWAWTKTKIAIMLRTDPRWIPDEWILRQQFQLWPPQHHRAVLWVIVHYAAFRAQ
jgi:hypothetical protein